MFTSQIFLCLLLSSFVIADKVSNVGPSLEKLPQDLCDLLNHQVSLVTVSNPANAPFYYHTSLEVTSFNPLTNECLDRHTYGLYPDFGVKSRCPLASIYRLLRPLWACQSKVLSPDPLNEGRGRIPEGKILYREDYLLPEKDFQDLQARILNWTKSYSYLGWFNTDNCSSWVRRLLTDHYFSPNNAKNTTDGNNGNGNNIDSLTCNRYYFSLPRFLGGKILRFPVVPFDFPKFCHSDSHMGKYFVQFFKSAGKDSVRQVSAMATTSRR